MRGNRVATLRAAALHSIGTSQCIVISWWGGVSPGQKIISALWCADNSIQLRYLISSLAGLVGGREPLGWYRRGSTHK